MTSEKRKYAVVFAGARDSYQAALAAEQAGALEALITDVFLPRPVAAALSASNLISAAHPRWIEGVPWRKVLNVPAAFFADAIRHRSGLPVKSGQSILAEFASSFVTRRNCSVFAYAGYALEAFRLKEAENRKKILFQYHPHRKLEMELLKNDCRRWSRFAGLELTYEKLEPDLRNSEEATLADVIVCCSSFTRQSLLYSGVDPAKIVLIPYGIDATETSNSCDNHDCSSSYLFVGSGLHRKGIHILLSAWKTANIKDATLTLVTSTRRYDYVDLCGDSESIKFISRVPRKQLLKLYDQSDICVLPSLSEGFGYVILEAASRGCFVIGSDHTAMTELLFPREAGTTVAAGDVDKLAEAIIEADRLRRAGELNRSRCRDFALDWSWARFRRSVQSVLSD